MQKNIQSFINVHPTTTTSYSFICDNYYTYLTQMAPYTSQRKSTKEGLVCSLMTHYLNNGITLCSLWVEDGDCLSHFQEVVSKLRLCLTELTSKDEESKHN